MSRNRLLAVAGIVGLVAVVLLGRSGGSDDGDRVAVVAEFSDASPLLKGNVVKASGVDVGTVKDIRIENGRARVEMELDRAVLPLHSDAKATITTQDLLGERFVRLEKGSADKPALPQPYRIPVSQTSRVVDLQDVLNSVDTPTSVALSALLTETGEGLRGHGKQADAAIAALAPALRQANDLAAVLRDQNALLNRLVDSAAPVASAVAAHDGKDLDGMVASATDLLAAVAAEREALHDSLQELPSTLNSARSTLAELAGVTDPATRTLRSLRPVTGNLKGISSELRQFADAADPALASLPPVLKEAKRLLDRAAPVVAALRPGAHDLVGTARAANTLSRTALSGKSLTDLMEFVKGWSLATSDYDAVSHYFKAMVPLSPAALDDTAEALVPALPDNVLDGLPVPTAPELPLPPRGGAGSGSGTSSGQQVDPDSATGLSETQETNLVGQIIGGLL